MSISSLLEDNWTVYGPVTSTKDASAGAVESWPTTAKFGQADSCKVEDSTAADEMRFGSYAQGLTHVVTTLRNGIQTHDKGITSDGRTLLILGVMKVRAQGGITETYYLVPCQEFRVGA